MGRSPNTPEQRLQYAVQMGVHVDPEDEWILAAFRLHIDGTQVRVRTHRMETVSLSHMILGPPPPRRNWSRWRTETRDYRRKNLFLAAPYHLSPANMWNNHDVRRPRTYDIERIERAYERAREVLTACGWSGRLPPRGVRLYEAVSTVHVPDVGDRAIRQVQDHGPSGPSDGTGGGTGVP